MLYIDGELMPIDGTSLAGPIVAGIPLSLSLSSFLSSFFLLLCFSLLLSSLSLCCSSPLCFQLLIFSFSPFLYSHLFRVTLILTKGMLSLVNNELFKRGKPSVCCLLLLMTML